MRLLCRLDPTTIQRPDALLTGLRRHLANAELVNGIVQRGDQQRAYVALDGCTGCAVGRCAPGCRVDLLRRILLAACDPVQPVTLSLVAQGLAAQALSRVVLATPGPRAIPLDATLLHHWSDARLTLRWLTVGKRLEAGAVLAVGAGDHEPALVLTAYGWRPTTLPVPLATRLLARPHMIGSPLTAATTHDPALAFAHTRAADTPAPALPTLPTAVAPARLALRSRRERLAPVSAPTVALARATVSALTPAPVACTLAPETLPAEPATPLARALALALNPPAAFGAALGDMQDAADPDSCSTEAAPLRERAVGATDADDAWPCGPHDLRPALVARAIATLLANGDVRARGLAKRTLATLVGAEAAVAWLVWLDAAGVLSAPDNPEPARRWRERRRFATEDLGQIASQLAATPLPDAAAVTAAATLLGAAS